LDHVITPGNDPLRVSRALRKNEVTITSRTLFFSAEIPWEIDERASIETFYSPPGKPRIIEKTASFQENAHHARSPAHAIVEKADGLR
jgi:hypothetical protein